MHCSINWQHPALILRVQPLISCVLLVLNYNTHMRARACACICVRAHAHAHTHTHTHTHTHKNKQTLCYDSGDEEETESVTEKADTI